MVKPQFEEGVQWMQCQGFVPNGPIDSAWTDWNLGDLYVCNRLAGSVWGCWHGGVSGATAGGNSPANALAELVVEIQSRGYDDVADEISAWLDAISSLES